MFHTDKTSNVTIKTHKLEIKYWRASKYLSTEALIILNIAPPFNAIETVV